MSGLSPPHLRPGRGEPSLEHCQVLQSRQCGEEVRKFARKARSFRAAPAMAPRMHMLILRSMWRSARPKAHRNIIDSEYKFCSEGLL